MSIQSAKIMLKHLRLRRSQLHRSVKTYVIIHKVLQSLQMLCSFMATGIATFGDSTVAVTVLSVIMAVVTICDTVSEPGKNAEEKRVQWANVDSATMLLTKALADGDEETGDRLCVEAAGLIKTIDLTAEVGYSNSDASPAREANL